MGRDRLIARAVHSQVLRCNIQTEQVKTTKSVDAVHTVTLVSQDHLSFSSQLPSFSLKTMRPHCTCISCLCSPPVECLAKSIAPGECIRHFAKRDSSKYRTKRFHRSSQPSPLHRAYSTSTKRNLSTLAPPSEPKQNQAASSAQKEIKNSTLSRYDDLADAACAPTPASAVGAFVALGMTSPVAPPSVCGASAGSGPGPISLSIS